MVNGIERVPMTMDHVRNEVHRTPVASRSRQTSCIEEPLVTGQLAAGKQRTGQAKNSSFPSTKCKNG